MVERAEQRETRRLIDARFPLIKRLEEFRFADNASVPQATIAALADGSWIDDASRSCSSVSREARSRTVRLPDHVVLSVSEADFGLRELTRKTHSPHILYGCPGLRGVAQSCRRRPGCRPLASLEACPLLLGRDPSQSRRAAAQADQLSVHANRTIGRFTHGHPRRSTTSSALTPTATRTPLRSSSRRPTL